jgi:hypothetical protein
MGGIAFAPDRRIRALGCLTMLLACARPDASKSDSARPLSPRDGASNATACGATLPPASGTPREIVISENARGMATTVRWARSPDGCALLIVEDPVGVEAEPIPDAVTYAAETRDGVRITRIDSVWDVAPDPAWQRLAVGRAYVARGGESDTLGAEAWRRLATAVGRSVADVRAAAFATSGMTIAMGVAQPAWTALPRVADDSLHWHTLPVLGGWRIAWAPDSAALLVGSGPRRVGDDEPAAAWLRVDVASGRPLGGPVTLPGSGPAAVTWHASPLLDVSTALSPDTMPSLATSAHGRLVLAAAPRPDARNGEVRWRVVLYVR